MLCLRKCVFAAFMVLSLCGAAQAANNVTSFTGVSKNWSDSTAWYIAKTGSITGSTSSATITGSGTAFNTELTNGDVIVLTDGTVLGTVQSIAGPGSLTLTANALATFSSAQFGIATGVPTAADTVAISETSTITVDVNNAACSALTLATGGPTGDAVLAFTGSGILTVTNAVTVGAMPSTNTGSIDMTGAGTLICDHISDVATNTFNAGSGVITFNNTASYTLPVNSKYNSFHIVNFNGAMPARIGQTTTFIGPVSVGSGGTLDLNTGSTTITFSGAVTVSGTLKITNPAASPNFANGLVVNNGGTFQDTLSSGMITFSGGGISVAAGGTFNATASPGATCKFTTTAQAISGTASMAALSSNSVVVTNNGNLTVDHFTGGATTMFTQGVGASLTTADTDMSALTLNASATGNTITFTNTGNFPGTMYQSIVINAANCQASANFFVNTLFQINNSSTFNGAGITLSLAGDFVNNGTFTASSSTVNFSGSAQAVTGSSATAFNVANFSGGVATFSGNTTITTGTINSGSTVNIAAGTLYVNTSFTNNGALLANDVMSATGTYKNGPNSILDLSGTVSTIGNDFTSANNVVVFSGGTQAVPAGTYFNIHVTNGGTKTATGTLMIGGDLVIGPSTTFDAGPGFTDSLAGNFVNSGGTFNGNTSTLQLNGPAPQSLVGPTTFTKLTIANPAGVTLAADQTINTGLAFTQGSILTGPFTLHLTPAAGVTGAGPTSYVSGTLSKTINPGLNAFIFPIGDPTAFAPVAVSNVVTATPGDLAVSTKNANHPQFASSGLDPNNNVKRFWTLSTPNGLGATFDATFSFASADVIGGPTSGFVARQFNGTKWLQLAQSSAAGVTTVTGLNSAVLDDFAIGLPLNTSAPVIQSLTASTSEVVVGDMVTFTATAAAQPLTYIFDFGDGTQQAVSSATGTAQVQHAFTFESSFIVALTVTDGFLVSTPQTVHVDADAPNSGGAGVSNVALVDPQIVSVTSFDGVTITVMRSDGGVITLGIDVQSLLSRDSYNVSTDFNGIGGRSDTVTGVTPTHKFTNEGVNVAVTTVTDLSNKVLGRGRKTIVVSGSEVGATPKFTKKPAVTSITSTTVKGNFSFGRSGTDADSRALSKPDKVTFAGAFEMPEGVDLSQEQDFQFAIGNVIDELTIDTKGNSKGVGQLKNIQKVKITYPHLPKGQKTTPAGAKAKFTLTMSNTGLSAAGFESDGITGALKTSEMGKKSVPRMIQVAMDFAGATYQISAPVQYTLSPKGDSGSISGRSGN